MKASRSAAAISLFALLFTLNSAASAATPYVGGSGAVGVFGGYGGDASIAVFRAQVGVDLARYFGIEAQFGVRALGDKIAYQGRNIEMQRFGAAYGRFIWPVSENGRLFALLGAGMTTVESSTRSGSSSDDSTGLSYGIGGEIAVTKTLRVGSDLIVLDGEGGSSLKLFSAGVRWSF